MTMANHKDGKRHLIQDVNGFQFYAVWDSFYKTFRLYVEGVDDHDDGYFASAKTLDEADAEIRTWLREFA